MRKELSIMHEIDDKIVIEEDYESPDADATQLKLDYTIESPVQRNELVKKIVESLPPQRLTNRYLEILADYIIFAMTKEERKTKNINTEIAKFQ